MRRVHEMFADPELPDENDPEFKEEMFNIYKYMNWQPTQETARNIQPGDGSHEPLD
jgi:hypothetical protein